jgi:creatinine amidohydrolase
MQHDLSLCTDSILSETVSVDEVTYPDNQKIIPDRTNMARLVGEKLKEFLGDGNMGGVYAHSDDDMASIWETAVAETRDMMEKGWD